MTAPGEGCIVGGDPTCDLEFAALEARMVANALGTDAQTGEHCNQEWLQRALETRHGRLRLVHLACHGVFRASRGEDSGLLMLEGGEPQVVSAARLARSDWSSDLVVISACSSGQQSLHAGDEFAGILQALLGAGARAVLVALWEISDLATFILVERLYECLKEHQDWDHPVLVEALYNAQRHLREFTAAELLRLGLRLRRTATAARNINDLRSAVRVVALAHGYAEQKESYRAWLDALRILDDEESAFNREASLEWEAVDAAMTMAEYKTRPFRSPEEWSPFVLYGSR
jgi:CHAT domain-containing protein